MGLIKFRLLYDQSKLNRLNFARLMVSYSSITVLLIIIFKLIIPYFINFIIHEVVYNSIF